MSASHTPATSPPPAPFVALTGAAPTPPSTILTANPSVASTRLVALDVFRGLTIAGMLLVNDPGSWGHIYPPLEHAAWHGWTPTDLIFPFFLFIVGITTHLSLSTRRARGEDEAALVRQIVRRGAVIIALGLLVSWFPFFTWGTVPGVSDPGIIDRVRDRLLHVRIPGILQRIGIAYMIAAFISLRASLRTQLLWIAGILLGYWALLTIVPVPDSGQLGRDVMDQPQATLAAWVDRLLLDWSVWGMGNHTWALTKTWDPEGPLSTIPTIATTLLGVVAGTWIGTRRPLLERLTALLAAGAIVAAAGSAWGWIFPINKNLWTSSFVLLTAGLAALTLGVCLWLVDVVGSRRWVTPFVIYGMNPIIAFVGAEVMARLIYSVITVPSSAGPIPLETAIYRSAFASWLDPRIASLAFAISFVLVWLAVLTVLYKRRIFVKV